MPKGLITCPVCNTGHHVYRGGLVRHRACETFSVDCAGSGNTVSNGRVVMTKEAELEYALRHDASSIDCRFIAVDHTRNLERVSQPGEDGTVYLRQEDVVRLIREAAARDHQIDMTDCSSVLALADTLERIRR